jgi:hypothetical protein
MPYSKKREKLLKIAGLPGHEIGIFREYVAKSAKPSGTAARCPWRREPWSGALRRFPGPPWNKAPTCPLDLGLWLSYL